MLSQNNCNCDKCQHGNSCTIRPAAAPTPPASQPSHRPTIENVKDNDSKSWEIISKSFKMNRKYSIIRPTETELADLKKSQNNAAAMIAKFNKDNVIPEDMGKFILLYHQTAFETARNNSGDHGVNLSENAMKRLDICNMALNGEIDSLPQPMWNVLADELQGLVAILSNKEFLERDGYLAFGDDINSLCKTAKGRIYKLTAPDRSKR